MNAIALPTGADLLTFLGWSASSRNVALAAEHVAHVTELAEAYTRGKGFEGERVDAAIARVIVGAAARSVSNPANAFRLGASTVTATPARFEGWTLAEQTVLNRWRVRTN